MGLLDRFKNFRDKRRQEPAVEVHRPVRRTHNISRGVDIAPRRNRQERRFLDIAVRRHAGRLQMRAEGKRAHAHRIPRHRRRLLCYLADSPFAAKRGRVAK